MRGSDRSSRSWAPPFGGLVASLWLLACSAPVDNERVQKIHAALGVADCPSGYNVILGTPANDSLNGTPGNDCIVGAAGDDNIDGRGGDDVLIGGTGADRLLGGGGNDRIYGEEGDDDLQGSAGNDVLEGGDGNDTIAAGLGTDHVNGGAGDDQLDGGSGTDELNGGEGNDRLSGGIGADTLVGGAGNDELDGGTGDDALVGGDGQDTLAGAAGDDDIDGGDGNDVVDGGGGRDDIAGGPGSDVIQGGSGADTIAGGAGDDAISGGAGDSVDGGTGDDSCSGAGCESGSAPGCNTDGDCSGGSRCSDARVCVVCLADAECDDGVFCNGAETCAPALGCVAGAPPPVDDGNLCTIDSCNEASDRVEHDLHDSDTDGAADCVDGCPVDPAKTAPGGCGCGIPDVDTNGDGVLDCQDGRPPDIFSCAEPLAVEAETGVLVPVPDFTTMVGAVDDSGRPVTIEQTPPAGTLVGVGRHDIALFARDPSSNVNLCVTTFTVSDGCPDDPSKTAPGLCGCGVPDTDSDGDGTADCIDIGVPAIGVSATSLTIPVQQGATRTAQISITNTGSGVLSGLQAGSFSNYFNGSPAPWATASLDRTTAPATLTITAAPGASIPAQVHLLRFDLTAPGATNSPFTFYTISVTVIDASITPVNATIAPSQTSPSISVPAGQSRQAQLTISNSGTDPLTNLAASPFSNYYSGAATPWVSASISQTTAPATLTITASPPVDLPIGSYLVRFDVTSPGATNSPFTFYTVYVTVTAPVEPRFVAAGGKSTCAMRGDKSLVCWGEASWDATTPPSGTFATIGGGLFHYCGVRSDQSLSCWGYNGDNRATPPATGTFSRISVGPEHNCALRTDDTAVCWGFLNDGRGSPPSGTYKQIGVGWYHGCAIRTDDTVVCWGRNDAGQASPPLGSFKWVSGGASHTCAIRTDDSVVCFGNTPPAPAGTFTQISAAGLGGHTCGIRADRTLACWGQNDRGQASPPVGQFLQVSVNNLHSCAVRNDDVVVCWGLPDQGATAVPPELTLP